MRPFEGASLADFFVQVLEREPAQVRQHRPEVSEALAAVVMKCLCKDAAARFTTVAHLARALAPFGTGRAASCVARSGVLLDDALGANGPTTAPLAGSPQPGAALAHTRAALAHTHAVPAPHGGVRSSNAPPIAAVLEVPAPPAALAPRAADVGTHTQSAWGETGPRSAHRSRGTGAAVAGGLAALVVVLGVGGGLYVRHARGVARAAHVTAITTRVGPAESVVAAPPPPATSAAPPPAVEAAPPRIEAAPPPIEATPSASVAVRAATGGKPRPRAATSAHPSPTAPPPSAAPPGDFLDQRH